MTTPWIIAFVMLWIIVLLTAIVTVGLLRRMGYVLEQVEARLASNAQDPGDWGVAVSTHVPEFRVLTSNGAPEHKHERASTELLEAPTIFLFMEANCGPCKELAGKLDDRVNEIDGVPFVVVLDDGLGRPEWLGPNIPTVYEREHEVSRAFQNRATPQAYLVDQTGRVLAKRVIGSFSDLREIARERPTTGGEAVHVAQ